MITRRRVAMILLLAPLAPLTIAQNGPADSRRLLYADLWSLRTQAEEDALLIKSTFSETSSELIAVRRQYSIARASVAKVVSLLGQFGLSQKKELAAEKQALEQAAISAREESKRFFSHVRKLTGNETRSIPVTISVFTSIVTLAIELLKLVSSSEDLGAKAEDRRRKLAAELNSELLWKPWAEL
jgi:hypothetical protein